MSDREVRCVVKANQKDHPNDRFITHIGGTWGKITEEEAIRDIGARTHTYFVNQGGRRVDVEVKQGPHRKFLKTKPDGYKPNNLLSLPACP